MKSRIISALIVCVGLCANVAAQSAGNKPNDSEVEARIASIVDRAAQPIAIDGPPGVKITLAGIAISPKDVQAVKACGDRAIPILSQYLLGPDSRRERVSIRLLGIIGSPAVLEPLVRVIDHSTRLQSREEAILNLGSASCAQAKPTLMRIAKDDRATRVRELAQSELSACEK